MRHLIAFALAAALLVPAATAAAPPRQPHTPAKPAGSPPPPAADSGDKDKPVSTKVEDLAKLLDAASIEYTKESGHLRVTFHWSDDDRSQLVILQPQPDLRGVPMLEIYSTVMKLKPKTSLSPAVAQRLLQQNGEQLLGYFGIENVEGTPEVFCYHNLPSRGLTSEALAVVLSRVATLADEMEKEQLGEKSDEF